MLTFFDGEPLKADLLLRGSTAIEFTIRKGNGYEKIENWKFELTGEAEDTSHRVGLFEQ